MSERIVNNITLQYLANMSVTRATKTKVENKGIPARKDVRFYKKRIVDMARKLMTSDCDASELNKLPVDLKSGFDLFAHRCVEYFKDLDRSEILQGEYGDMCDKEEIDTNVDAKTQAYADELFVKSVQVKQESSLDKFVVRTKVSKTPDPMELPRKRDVKLRTSELKTKGIAKKNLHNKYDEASKDTGEQTKT
jgi:hypothetical protein